MKVNLVCFLSFFTLLLPATASTEPVAPTISAISELAKALINEKISIPAKAKVDITPQNIDARMLPSQCTSPIKVEMASDRDISRNNTIKVSCHTPELAYPWQIFIDRKSVV